MAIFTQNSTESDKMDIRANWLNFVIFVDSFDLDQQN